MQTGGFYNHMKLLFTQAGPILKFDAHGNAYVGSNEDRAMWKRYRSYCDELRLLFRVDSKIYEKSELLFSDYQISQDLFSIVFVPNINRPRKNLFNLKLRKKAVDIISQEVQKSDRVIVRTCGFWPSPVVIDMCRKYNKPYLIEVVEFPSEIRRYSNNPLVRLLAPCSDFTARREIARASYVVYVTQNALQKRYPTSGKTLSCSDVELQEPDQALLDNRINNVQGGGHTAQQ